MVASCPTDDRAPVGLFVFGFVIAGVLLLFGVFVAVVVKNFDDIIARNSTISAYCANPAIFASRFLLLSTAVIGLSLTVAYVSAYNSIPQGRTPSASQIVRFSLRIVTAMIFPFVGIFFYALDEPYSDFGVCRLRSIVSSWIHLGAALTFFLGSTALNVWETITMIQGSSPSAAIAWTLFALSVISAVLLAVFIVAQAFVFLTHVDVKLMQETLREYRAVPKRRRVWDPRTPEEIQFRQVHKKVIGMRRLHVVSFLSELGMVLFVTITSLLVAVARNRCVSIIK